MILPANNGGLGIILRTTFEQKIGHNCRKQAITLIERLAEGAPGRDSAMAASNTFESRRGETSGGGGSYASTYSFMGSALVLWTGHESGRLDPSRNLRTAFRIPNFDAFRGTRIDPTAVPVTEFAVTGDCL